MHIHILGICGTFMGGLALIARQLGHRVTGCDANVYPPMSTQLAEQGIELIEGFDPVQLDPAPDLVLIGNAMSRGNPCVEYVLDRNLPYRSGPQWLSEAVLEERWVIALAGTHGKTTTSAMVAWILVAVGLEPGFLIGGIPRNLAVSARLGQSPFFVIEADEYDCAFFDKRSKFVHYHPRTLVLNNLEYDHADIFPDLASIQRQFHHLMRVLPGSGKVLYPADSDALQAVIEQGCWSAVETLGGDWHYRLLREDGSHFEVRYQGLTIGEIRWSLIGLHNVHNGLMALAAAHHAGVTLADALAQLCRFESPKRRLELLGRVADISVYDDFAHHPTAIRSTLAGLRASVGPRARILAVLEPRSNTMRMGVHQDALASAFDGADEVYLYQPADLSWSLAEVMTACPQPVRLFDDLEALLEQLGNEAQPGDHLLLMSNGGFGGLHRRLLDFLATRYQNLA